MTNTPQFIYGRDGLKLHVHHFESLNPKAVVCIIPGFGEHGGRYEHVASFLVKRDVSVMAMDCRGHGRSDGLRGHAKSLDILLDDVEELLKLCRSTYLDVPIILMGHSMGGNLVLNYVLRKPLGELVGFISSSPWIALGFSPPKWKLALGKLMARYIPKLRQPSGLDVTALSKIEEVGKKYLEDPLVHTVMSAGLFYNVTKGCEYIVDHIEEISIPGLIYHGDADRLISFSKTEEVASKLGDKITWKPLKGVYHEPHNDEEKEDVLNMIYKFIITCSK